MRMSWMLFCQESSWHNFLEEEKAHLNCSTLRVHWFTDEETCLLNGSQMDDMIGRKCKLERSSWALDIGWLHYAQCCDSGVFCNSSPSQLWVSSILRANCLIIFSLSFHSSWKDLQAEKLLEFFFGHRSHSESFGKGPVQRWLHLRGCHLMLLMALTVKYRLSPLGVEDIIEQGSRLSTPLKNGCPQKETPKSLKSWIETTLLPLRHRPIASKWPYEFVIWHHNSFFGANPESSRPPRQLQHYLRGPTKVDLHGVNIFITLDQLHVKNSNSSCRSGSSPVQIGSSHVTLILSAPHRPDTLNLDIFIDVKKLRCSK